MKEILYLLSYAWKKSKLLFLTTSLKYIFSGTIPLIGIVGLGIVVDAIESGQTSENVIKAIIIYITVNLCVSLIRILLTFLDNIVMRKASDKIQLDYAQDCVNINYHYVEDKSVLELKKKSMGANPVWFLDEFFVLFLYLVQFFGVTYIFAELSPWFILVVMLTSLLNIALNFQNKKIGYKFSVEQSEENRQLEYLYRTMTDYKYAKDIRINGADELIGNKYKNIQENLFSKTKKNEYRKLAINTASVVITTIQTVAMYGYFSWQVYSNEITIAEYTMLLGATTLFTSILIGFFGSVANVRNTIRYTKLFQDYKEMIDRNSTISKDRKGFAIDWCKPTISFSHVYFSYPNSDHEVLKDINFTMYPNEHIGIVGLNGSGKTTIIKLLLRLYDPTDGIISINGTDIKDIPYKEYVDHIGIILQDFYVFAFSVKENIVFDDGMYDEKLCISSLKKDGVYDKISGLPYGINTSMYKYCDENGVELSGGENQKLCIARALYKDADVMVMDEPSSTLDPLAEYQLFTNLVNLSDNKPTLFISHRLSSTVFCDRILVLSNGEIVETGSHSELIKNNGLYSELYNTQAGYYKIGGKNET